MKNNVEEIYNEAADKWRNASGVGSIVLTQPLDIIKLAVHILDKMIVKSPNLLVMIICENLTDRANILYAIENTSANSETYKKLIAEKYINVFTRDYIEKSTYRGINKKDLLITINVTKFKGIIERYEGASCFKYKLVLTNEIDKVASNAVLMYQFAPKVYSLNYSSLLSKSINSPVKEYQIGCALSQPDQEHYDKCTNYINDSINIFGDFSKIEECRVGNRELNLSAEACRTLVAEYNGWRPVMDMSDIMAKRLDDLYNPIALGERVNQVYNIMRERRNLVTDNIVKLEKILEIVKSNLGKKILIVSMRGEFASKITDYINSNVECTGKSVPTNGEIFDTNIKFLQYDYCGNYHNDMEGIPAYDKFGKPKVYKSGKKIGQPIIMQAKAQRSQNLTLFNDDCIRVLSANNSIDTDFNAIVDLVIFTSPMCYSLRDIKYRIPNLSFSTEPNIVYKVYIVNSIEEKKLNETKGGKNYEVVKDCENDDIAIDF